MNSTVNKLGKLGSCGNTCRKAQAIISITNIPRTFSTMSSAIKYEKMGCFDLRI